MDHSRTILRTIVLSVWPGLSTLSLLMISPQRLWLALGAEPRFASTVILLKDHADSIIVTLDLCRSLLLSSHDLPLCIDLHVLSFACHIAQSLFTVTHLYNMHFPTFLILGGLASAAVAQASYSIEDDYTPSSFFGMFDFFTVGELRCICAGLL